MEQMDLVRRITPSAEGFNDLAENKPIAPGDKLFTRVRQIRSRLNMIDNTLCQAIALMKEVTTLNDMDTQESKCVCEKTADKVCNYIQWCRKWGPITIRKTIEVLVTIEQKIDEKEDCRRENELERQSGWDPTDNREINKKGLFDN